FVQGGADDLKRRFLDAAPRSWSATPVELLADLAHWLAQEFNAADPAAASLQVWVGPLGAQGVKLYGRPRANMPPPPLILAGEIPCADTLPTGDGEPVAVIAHYDVHGLVMLALTLRFLRARGVSRVDCALGFEWTGEIGKLWKRAVPKTIASDENYRAVILLDCPVHSRRPERTLKAINRLDDAPDCRLLIVDHHPDTIMMAPELAHPQVDLVLTDVFSCGLTGKWGGVETNLMAMGTIADKVAEVAAAYPAQDYAGLHGAVEEFDRRALHFSPTPPEMKEQGIYPLQPLWEALAEGKEISPSLAEETLGPLEPWPPYPTPAYEVAGSLLIVTETLAMAGRAWYALLERLMELEGVPYALALRLLDGKRANFLLLSNWQMTYMPPVKSFIPPAYLPRCLGHPSALWVDLHKEEALEFIGEVAERLNGFADTPAGINKATGLLRDNIIDPQPQETIISLH
ncbi:hypothetical protein IIA79_06600, partial [bacterium]|nr:hypothetical protein [bacterium]